MKTFAVLVVKYLLKIISKIYIRLYKIEVVAITGSAGKTTAKRVVEKLTADLGSVYVPRAAYNTEFGIPMAIFKEKSPTNTSSISQWSRLLLRMFMKLFIRPKFKTIVLEYGADKPGDIKYLCRIAAPKISLVTAVLPVHLEGFGNIEEVAFEKKSLIWLLKKGGIGIVNDDSPYLRGGFEGQDNIFKISQENSNADYFVRNLKSDLSGTSFDLVWKKETYHLSTPLVGEHLIYSLVGGIAISLTLGVDPQKIISNLANLSPEPGRMSIIRQDGITIIDDSYNSNPESLIKSLVFLGGQKGRRVAVLGNMNELGLETKKIHREVGKTVEDNVDLLLTVGELAGDDLAYYFKKQNPSNFYGFMTPYQAGERLAQLVKPGDIILFKGSQNGVFTEEAIKYILDKKINPEKVLVRQGKFWITKKKKYLRSIK